MPPRDPLLHQSGSDLWFCPTHGLTCAQQRGSDGIWRCAPGGHNLVGYVPSDDLQGAVDALNEFRGGLTEALNAHGVPAMPSWRDAIDWLAANGGGS